MFDKVLVLLEGDRLDEAHDLVQNDPSSEAAYLHGMIHRQEGDQANARYWFARARTVVERFGFDPTTVDREIERKAIGLDFGAL